MADRCPVIDCPNARQPKQYLCKSCWFTLSEPVRDALWRKDEQAGWRYLQLMRAVRQGQVLSTITVEQLMRR